MTQKLPTAILVAGIPCKITYADEVLTAAGIVSKFDVEAQEISVHSTLPAARQISYVFTEIAFALLSWAGLPPKKTDRLVERFGHGLHDLARDNNFSWLRSKDAALPDTVTIGGLQYHVTRDADAHLEDTGLSGEIDYRNLTIAILSTLGAEMCTLVFFHEIAHGVLYESGCSAEQSDENLVEPLGHFLYQLFKQNDFSFACRVDT